MVVKNPVARTETRDLSSAAVTNIEGRGANTKEIASMEATAVMAEMEVTAATAKMEATAAIAEMEATVVTEVKQ